MSQKLRAFSPLALLGLAACGGGATTQGGGGGQSGAQSNGVAVKGLLQNALAFVDSDGSLTRTGNEAFTRTNENGEFTLDNPNGDPIVILTDSLTTDKSSGAVAPGVRLIGASDVAVISPFSGLAFEGVDTAELAKALNVEGVDLLTFNPFAAGVDANQALAVEKLSQQMVGTLKILAGAMISSGASTEANAFNDAFDALVETAKDQLTETTPSINFESDALLTALVDKVNDGGEIDAAKVTALVGQIKQLNTLIDDVADLDSTDTKDVFSSSQVLAEAYQQGVDTGNAIDVEAVTQNSVPVDITLTSENGDELQVTETVFEGTPATFVQDRTVGTVGVADDGAQVGTVEIVGTHGALFEIVEGVLMLREGVQINHETTKTLSITLIAKDAGGKAIARDFEIKVENVNEPTVDGGAEITGSFRALESLSVDLSEVSDPDNAGEDFAEVSYQWLVDGNEVDGATNATFAPTAEMVGSAISVIVTVTDQGGNSEQLTIEDTTGYRVTEPKYEAIEDAPIEARVYDGFATAKEALPDAADNLVELAGEWAQNVVNFMGGFQDSLDAVANDVNRAKAEDTNQDAGGAAFARAAFVEEDQGPDVTYLVRTTSSGYLEWVANIDWDGDGERDNWIEIEYEDLNASSLQDIITIFNGISLSDPSTLSVVGKVHEIEFNSVTEEVEITHRDSSSSNYDSHVRVSYEKRDENGDTIEDPAKLESLNLLGTFENGIEPLLKTIASLQEKGSFNTLEDAEEPDGADFVNAGTGEFDRDAYEAAVNEFDQEQAQAKFDIVSALLGGDGQETIAGLEGISLDHYRDADGNREEAFAVDLFDAPDSNGDQHAKVVLGDYTLLITGDLPETPGELLPLLNPVTGIGPASDYLDSLKESGAEPSAAELFEMMMNGFTHEGTTYAGLKDGGFGDISSIELRATDGSGAGPNGDVVKVDIDFEAVAKLAIEKDGKFDDTDPVVFTDEDTGHSVAQHPDGVYVVLGEGIALDDFKAMLDLDDTGAAVA